MHKLVCPSVSERWDWMYDLWCLCQLIFIFYGDVSFKCLNIYFSMPDCLVWMIDFCGIYVCSHQHVHLSLYTGIFWIRINYWTELNWTDPWKFMDLRALTVIFNVGSWKMRKEIGHKFFWWLWKNPEPILINMFSPTFVPNLVTLAWKMSSGMPKEADSLNGPLCAYSMRQNLHDRTRPRS